VQSQQEQRPVHFNYAFSQAQRFVDVLLVHTNRSCNISMPHIKKCTPTSYICHPLRSASWEVNQGQVNIRWMTMSAAPDGILEMLTVVVSLNVQQPRTQGSLCAGQPW
jgi:hypothetical protein